MTPKAHCSACLPGQARTSLTIPSSLRPERTSRMTGPRQRRMIRRLSTRSTDVDTAHAGVRSSLPGSRFWKRYQSLNQRLLSCTLSGLHRNGCFNRVLPCGGSILVNFPATNLRAVWKPASTAAMSPRQSTSLTRSARFSAVDCQLGIDSVRY